MFTVLIFQPLDFKIKESRTANEFVMKNVPGKISTDKKKRRMFYT